MIRSPAAAALDKRSLTEVVDLLKIQSLAYHLVQLNQLHSTDTRRALLLFYLEVPGVCESPLLTLCFHSILRRTAPSQPPRELQLQAF